MTTKSFRQMIADKEVRRADAMKVRLEDLHEEPGFNLRREGEELEQSIAELAEFLADGGQVPALEVRPRDEGGVWLVDGHRRTRAWRLLDAQGRLKRDPKTGEFLVSIVPFEGTTKADRIARVMTSREAKDLDLLELADGCSQLRGEGLSNDEIAKKIRKTRQYVDQMLILADAPAEVHQMVESGAVAPATAVTLVRQHGEKAAEVMAEELEKAKAQGKGKVTAGTLKGPSVPRGLLDDLHSTVTRLHKSFSPDDLVAIERFHRGEITEGTITIPVEMGMHLHLILEEGARVLAEKEAKAREKADKARQLELAQDGAQ